MGRLPWGEETAEEEARRYGISRRQWFYISWCAERLPPDYRQWLFGAPSR